MDFEEVDYWEELTQVFEWAKRHVFLPCTSVGEPRLVCTTVTGFKKLSSADKLSGIYDQVVVRPESLLMRGFDDCFLAPHSRYTDIPLKEVLEKSNLQVIAQGNEVGLSIIASPDMREVYSFGHLEYDRDTLAKEYHRDVKAGLDPALPKNYFDENDANTEPRIRWNLAATTFFSN